MRNATYTGGVQSLEIKVGTTSVAPASITTNLTTNITGTQATVFKGSYNYPNMVPNTDPTKWHIPFPWNAPWPWTAPSGQHLAIEVAVQAGEGDEDFLLHLGGVVDPFDHLAGDVGIEPLHQLGQLAGKFPGLLFGQLGGAGRLDRAA